MNVVNESNTKISVILFSMIFFLSFFQNCSEVAFEELKEQSSTEAFGDVNNPPMDPESETPAQPPEIPPTLPPVIPPILPPIDPPTMPPIDAFVPQSFEFDTTTTLKNVDILFVVDESISMNNILKQVNEGFKTITSLDYPENIKFAVTNMAPAKETNDVLDAELSPFYIGSSVKDIHTYPGYLKLVDAESIQNYGKMNIAGCSEQWFHPLAKNANADFCLTAATQIANTATYYETGVTTFKQLLQVYDAKSKELFRRGSLANVVFVSDTHDAGGSYYGKKHAAKKMISVQNILSRIHTMHGNDLADFKFSGIVKLPEDSDHEKLQGVNVVGQYGGRISTGESDNGFSYLQYIKDTGGVAAHVVQPNNDYTPIIKELIKSSAQSSVPTFELAGACDGALQVTLNDELLHSSDYQVFNMGLGIKLIKEVKKSGNNLHVDCLSE